MARTPGIPGRELSPYEIQLVRELFEKGMTRKNIAEKLGWTYSTICKYLTGRSLSWSPTKMAEVTELIKLHGKKWQKIGKLVGLTPDAVKNFYRRHLMATLELPVKKLYREKKKPGPKGELLGPSKPPRPKKRKRVPVTAMIPKFADHAAGVVDPWDEDRPIGSGR